MSIRHLLNASVTITRDGTVSDGAGGHVRTAGTPVPLPAKIDAAGATDRAKANRDTDRVTHVGYFEAGVDIVRDDVIDDGTTKYKMLSALPPSAPDHFKILMEVI